MHFRQRGVRLPHGWLCAEYGSLAFAFERCLFIMIGEFGPYEDIVATPGLAVIARLWFWLYVGVVLFILLNVRAQE